MATNDRADLETSRSYLIYNDFLQSYNMGEVHLRGGVGNPSMTRGRDNDGNGGQSNRFSLLRLGDEGDEGEDEDEDQNRDSHRQRVEQQPAYHRSENEDAEGSGDLSGWITIPEKNKRGRGNFGAERDGDPGPERVRRSGANFPSGVGAGRDNGCFKCGNTGHWAKECPNDDKHGGRGAGGGEKKLCNNCDDPNHIAKDCPHEKVWSRVQCNNCQYYGHTKARCTEEGGGNEGGTPVGEETAAGGGGGGGGDGRECHNCGNEGHLAKDCPEEKKRVDPKDYICGNCKDKGHTAPQCHQSGGGREGQSPWVNDGGDGSRSGGRDGRGGGGGDKTCYNCGGVGHISRKCPLKDGNGGGGNDGDQVSNSEQEPEENPFNRHCDEGDNHHCSKCPTFKLNSEGELEQVVVPIDGDMTAWPTSADRRRNSSERARHERCQERQRVWDEDHKRVERRQAEKAERDERDEARRKARENQAGPSGRGKGRGRGKPVPAAQIELDGYFKEGKERGGRFRKYPQYISNQDQVSSVHDEDSTTNADPMMAGYYVCYPCILFPDPTTTCDLDDVGPPCTQCTRKKFTKKECEGRDEIDKHDKRGPNVINAGGKYERPRIPDPVDPYGPVRGGGK